MGFGVIRIYRQCSFVMEQRIGKIATGGKHVGQMKSGLCIPLIECDSGFEVKMGSLELADTNVARPEQNMISGRLAGDINRPADQFARLVEVAKLAANHSQPAKGAEMPGLIGEDPSIGLFGGLQGVLAAHGICRSNALPVGKG